MSNAYIIKAGAMYNDSVSVQSENNMIAVQPHNGTDFSLEELQSIVDGYIEILPLNDGRLIVCDEEGQLKGKVFNYRASHMWGDVIVGDVLVCDSNMIK